MAKSKSKTTSKTGTRKAKGDKVAAGFIGSKPKPKPKPKKKATGSYS